MIARQAAIYLNIGAYAENSPLVSAKAAIRILGPYRYEAVEVVSYAVYTNTCPASSYRGFGINQVALAAEVQMDELAQAGASAELPPWWEPCIAGVEVEVNPKTGQIQVHKLVTLADVGLAINPATTEGQDLGSATMGLGVALGEELIYDGQQLANGSLLAYRVPRFSDVPPEVRSLLVEGRDGVGPYGTKGIGDGPTGVMCPAVSNAIYRALGVRLRQAPFTPERLWRALQAKPSGS